MKSALLFLCITGAVLSHQGHHSDHGGHGRPLPRYLNYVSDEARKEYYGILSNNDRTIAQQKQDIADWAEKYGVEKQVDEFNANMTKVKEEIKRNVTNLIDDLPSAHERFSKIMENEDQTRAERRRALDELSAQNPKLFHVLRFAIDHFKPWHGRDGHGSHGSHGRHHGGRGSHGQVTTCFCEEDEHCKLMTLKMFNMQVSCEIEPVIRNMIY
ncbi:hypothetical protein TELCIR_13396 [Teladorsagia circumcincta]|uniref:SXP/RAL-2 family protein Ani s 5-like cation-binding domain-containing protein n=1 Tax=Teladorsagia circumcincta TaxID=45464 RepID=A0A2G9U447_TELCI|nr:hypothetical protein TELCIR_13396 [Teladorsagia circumcincta]